MRDVLNLLLDIMHSYIVHNWLIIPIHNKIKSQHAECYGLFGLLFRGYSSIISEKSKLKFCCRFLCIFFYCCISVLLLFHTFVVSEFHILTLSSLPISQLGSFKAASRLLLFGTGTQYGAVLRRSEVTGSFPILVFRLFRKGFFRPLVKI